MLKKMVNGEEVICSPEEEAEILAEWSENDKKAKQELIKQKERTALVDKFGDIYEFLDALMNHLKIDPSELKK